MLKLTFIACGNKMPKWVMEGVMEFKKRLAEYVRVQLIEIPLEKRSKSQAPSVYQQKESDKMCLAIPPGSYIIALDQHGTPFSSESLAKKLAQLPLQHPHLCFLIGGPDGMDHTLLQMAQEKWALSSFTLPHPLVRIIILEVLYRAFSILNHHPYHR